MTGDNDSRPGETGSPGSRNTGTGAGAGTGQGPHPKGNGEWQGFFTDTGGDAEDDSWRANLPTAAMIAGTPMTIYESAHLLALAKLREVDPGEYLVLTRTLIDVARHKDVTRALVDAAVKAGARKVKQEAKAEAAASGEDDDSAPVADLLVRQIVTLVSDGQAILGITGTGMAYIRCRVGNGVLATYRVEGALFQGWLRRRYYSQTQKSLRPDVLKQIANTIAALADEIGKKIDRLFVRVARHEGRLYLDLGTPDWSAVEIGPGLGEDGCGWRIVAQPPVWFARSPTMKPLPIPVPGGSINELRPFLNIVRDHPDNDDFLDSGFILSVGHCVSALNPDGPFPITLGQGPDGSAKTTWLRLMRSLIDPGYADCRGPPATTLDLLRHAQDSWMPSYDNISSIPSELCNAFCRVSTGGGDAPRKYYTDNDVVIYESTRPVLMTSIMDALTRPDILSRTVIVQLEKPAKRQTEKALFAAFDIVHPRILGALLSAAAHGLAQPASNYPLPRLADVAEWVSRCAGGLGWDPDTFVDALQGNAEDNLQNAADSDPLVRVLPDILKRQPQEQGRHHWSGRVFELQKLVRIEMGDYEYRLARLPQADNHFSSRLRQATPLLSRVGITRRRPRSNKNNSIELWLAPEETTPAVQQGDEPESQPAPTQTPSPPQAEKVEVVEIAKTHDLHPSNPQNSAISGDRGDRGDRFISSTQRKKIKGVDSASARSPAQAGPAAGSASEEELW